MTAISLQTAIEFKIACATLFTEFREQEFSLAKHARNILITALAVSIILALSLAIAGQMTVGKWVVMTCICAALSIAAITCAFRARNLGRERDSKNGIKIPFTELSDLQNVHFDDIQNIRIAPSHEFDKACLRTLTFKELSRFFHLVTIAFSKKKYDIILDPYKERANETNPMERMVSALRAAYLSLYRK